MGIEYDRIYSFGVGGVRVLFGRSSTDSELPGRPLVYGAAMSEGELRAGNLTGFGATESEAAADLFRVLAAQ